MSTDKFCCGSPRCGGVSVIEERYFDFWVSNSILRPTPVVCIAVATSRAFPVLRKELSERSSSKEIRLRGRLLAAGRPARLHCRLSPSQAVLSMNRINDRPDNVIVA